MDQQRHDPDYWITPLGAGFLVELDLNEQDTNLHLPGGSVEVLGSGIVRNISPQLPDQLHEKFLPGGVGSEGTRILAAKTFFSRLEDPIYEALGTTAPDNKNPDLGALAFIDYRRLEATIPEGIEDENPPFNPLGENVFLEFKYDERSGNVVGQETGTSYGPEDDAGEADEILIPERSKAYRENTATVTKTGPDAEHVDSDDEVIPPVKDLDVLEYRDTDYYFVNQESKLKAVLR
jgi:hypothetical protein